MARCHDQLLSSGPWAWSLTEFSWAWFTVNTRAVFLDHDPRFGNKKKTDSGSSTRSEDCLGEYTVL